MNDAPNRRVEDYALIGDCHSAALVGLDGSIDWLCLPRFDSDASFAALLGGPEHGHWRIAPEAGGRARSRSYRGDTLVLETRWDTPDGSAVVLDLMPPRGEAAHVVRIVEGVRGAVPMELVLRPKFGYGEMDPWIVQDEGQVNAVSGPDAIWLRGSVPLRHDRRAARASFVVGEGQRVSFVLSHRASYLPRPDPVDADRALDETMMFWEDWIARCDYRGRWAGAVRRSLLTLKALTYAPTGGIVAAATTSLPEQIGGPRNWDYRFCWLRDATFALQALLGTGYIAEARAWREWLLRAVAGDPSKLRIMYGPDGSRSIPERELDWLPGFRDSAPVRAGNAAVGQRQLDVWGEVLDLLHHARLTGLEPTDAAWDVQRGLLDWLEGHWSEPDNSLWEMRGERRHFVYSKVMAWAGVDRGLRTIERREFGGPAGRWRALREEIRDEVLAQGFDADRGTFTQFYGSQGVDAALLLLPRVGFLAWNDPRMLGTIAAVERDLCRGEFLARYDPEADGGPDGLPGGEGAFLACSFWHADAMHATGRPREAERLFGKLLELRNDVGLLSEEYDVAAGRQLGNTPQAFSMVGLVNTARRLGGGSMDTHEGSPVG
ncbi:glycoside hydrolase family 15 protein [Myceligenerans indicum]|uniref:Glycoside hydrolase family 15 protein n=1 Tax=Myceligenerans indicum TaxID=2593663 RepID=A0ABS1LMT0_9MICO|nr:glycoside hydrolase family 15 protein [Myceligenerans indicum]MBL0887575.1 glycoside hydrolase family 15 protein [Myceligenerans indicum]